jgi:hypothetical protein
MGPLVIFWFIQLSGLASAGYHGFYCTYLHFTDLYMHFIIVMNLLKYFY